MSGDKSAASRLVSSISSNNNDTSSFIKITIPPRIRRTKNTPVIKPKFIEELEEEPLSKNIKHNFKSIEIAKASDNDAFNDGDFIQERDYLDLYKASNLKLSVGKNLQNSRDVNRRSMTSYLHIGSLEREKYQTIRDSFNKGNEICKIDKLMKLQKELGSVNPETFRKSIHHNFYDPIIMKQAMCLTSSILYLSSSEKTKMFKRNLEEVIPADWRIRNWIRNLKKIGEDSSVGIATTGSLENSSNVFVVKAPVSSEDNNEMLHEWFIGIYGTNKMREYIPNFAYVYGGFKCSPLSINQSDIFDKGNALTWCTGNSRNLDYLVYENIFPSMSFYDYTENCSFEEYLDKYLQILFSLDMANRLIGFTHYDLHGENVLIRRLTDIPSKSYGIDDNFEKFYIPYDLDGKKYYLKTDAISTIIDYGRSHIIYNKKHYGPYMFFEYGYRPNAVFPLHDAYKLLLGSLKSMIRFQNDKCFEKASEILKFFNQNDPPKIIIEKEFDIYFSLQYLEENMVPISSLIEFIEKIFPDIFQKIVATADSLEPNVHILGCSENGGNDICLRSSEDNDYNNVGLSGEIGNDGSIKSGILADTMFEFYDLVTKLQNEQKDISEVVDQFERFYSEQKTLTLLRAEAIIDESLKLSENFKFLSLQNLFVDKGGIKKKLSDDESEDFWKEYFDYFSTVIKLYDLYKEFVNLFAASKFAANIYNDLYVNVKDEVYTSWIETLDNLNKKWLNVFGDSTTKSMTKSMTKSVKSIKSDSERYYFLRPGEITFNPLKGAMA